ncbi:site-specific integrase [Vibrio parahaemolyticus]|uniref:tyrosine-type recombinase/integrase n=2 Tax=Vibrio parahaemolyticus TaxID=670 RepID=UPI0006A5C42A|nr:site-specific integrase [Vibrio parahaemolyticus]EGQ8307308.1 tyrosine-type recombinase/integrase [Vibrio parahaemolyticus]EGQ8680462.1 tyrosine-type recombinase/integrase [Vibrio parahaemolyticus]EGQ8699531.1 tyrosine-type recombinase/integrase [Vibrio parahaemolyticus]EGQ8753551.1 tyrosine-type recombinase/integrase [Vibrio parahaemolyticus]EGQ8758456.1 tyrosine-type recombinase/integrase [Vibrio parahaemolyticus]
MPEFRLIKTKLNTLNKIQFVLQEDTSEIIPELATASHDQYIKEVQLILDPDGCLVYPQSLYIMSKLRGRNAVKNTKTHEQAMLLYTRWLNLVGMSYTDLTEYEEEGAPWQFSTFLLENIRKVNPDGSTTEAAYSVNTARAYMGVVLNFYSWLINNRYLPLSKDKVVCSFFDVKTNSGQPQHDILAHTNSGRGHYVQTNSILRRFPRTESTSTDKKLKPMTVEDEAIFDQYVNRLEKPFPLMFWLAKATGLRAYELATFPAAKISEFAYEVLEKVQFHISPDNGCHTKFSKPRTIEIPVDIFSELEAYYYSNERMENLEKCELYHEPLFPSNKGRPYATNTLSKQFEKLRELIRTDHPYWYYREHDLRSTFATSWMKNESEKRVVSYDFLIDELADLMGHKNTSTTEKYVNYLNRRKSQLAVAKKKNNLIQGLQNNG